jgi:hypothetical protein
MNLKNNSSELHPDIPPRMSPDKPDHTTGENRFKSRIIFWAGFIVLLIAAACMRCWHLDMPPIDFPADRQKSNTLIIEKMVDGAGLLDFKGPWLELRMLPWLVAKNRVLCDWFDCEIWTLARIFSVIFGLLMVALSPMIGIYSLGGRGVPWTRRYLAALVLMAAVAFNPYHVELSRMITTEPLTLACQAAMVGFFWMAMQQPTRKWVWLLFLIFAGLAVLGKIPSLIWLPSMALYFVFQKHLDTKLKIVFGILYVIMLMIVFRVQEINPFHVFESYETNYALHSGEVDTFIHGEIWTRTYLGRCFLMLTFPGVCLALLGLFIAPWFYRITFLFCLVILYPLNNLNIYNFSHLILPGMVLASYGALLLLELPASNSIVRIPGNPPTGWLAPACRVTGGLLLITLVFLLYPLGPQFDRVDNLRGELIQPADVVSQLRPIPSKISTGDGTGALGYFINHSFPDLEVLIQMDFMPGIASDHYMLDRYGGKCLKILSDSWVAWANIPGEFSGVVVNNRPEVPAALNSDQYTIMRPGQDQRHAGLRCENIRVPHAGGSYSNGMLNVSPGDTFDFDIRWINPGDYRLAVLYTMHQDWNQMVPMPVRAGGLTLNTRSVLCIPKGAAVSATYTVELPPIFPAGIYYFYYFPIRADEWGEVMPKPVPMPLILNCTNESTDSPRFVESRFINTWPLFHDGSKILWQDALHFKDMSVEGYEPSVMAARHGYLIPTPGFKPGRYTLTLTGEATPITTITSRDFNWPEIRVFLPHSPKQPAGSILMTSKKTGRFSLTFDSDKPFDSIRISSILRQAKMGRMPRWLMHFKPAEYGERRYQRINLRGYELKHEPVAAF